MKGFTNISIESAQHNKALQTDGAIAFFSSSFVPSQLDADRAPQLKAVVMLLR